MALDFSFNGEPTPVSKDSLAIRRKLAAALLQQGTDTTPVRAWSQGAARLAQSLMGGLDLGMADVQEAGAQKQAIEQAIQGIGSGGQPPAMPPGPPPLPPGGPSGPPMPPPGGPPMPPGGAGPNPQAGPPIPPVQQATEGVTPMSQGDNGGTYLPPKVATGLLNGPGAQPPGQGASPVASALAGPPAYPPPSGVTPGMIRAMGNEFLPPAIGQVLAGQVNRTLDPYGTEGFKNLEAARHNRVAESQTMHVVPIGATALNAQGQPVFGGAGDDVKSIVTGIKNGTLPPVTTGMPRATAQQVTAQLANDGFDLTNAKLQHDAAHKQVLSLNSTQMVKYVGLSQSVINTIDEVNSLAKQMANSGIPLMNKAKMELYTQTAGNTEAGKLTARYLAGVNTLKEEFANLAQGGYAPTEAAWGLADKQINGNYGVDQLAASLEEVQRLIRYRLQGIPNINTLGPGAGNRYVPPAGGTPPVPPAAAGTSNPNIDALVKKYGG